MKQRSKRKTNQKNNENLGFPRNKYRVAQAHMNTFILNPRYHAHILKVLASSPKSNRIFGILNKITLTNFYQKANEFPRSIFCCYVVCKRTQSMIKYALSGKWTALISWAFLRLRRDLFLKWADLTKDCHVSDVDLSYRVLKKIVEPIIIFYETTIIHYVWEKYHYRWNVYETFSGSYEFLYKSILVLMVWDPFYSFDFMESRNCFFNVAENLS
jgi:hypothetical protein